MASTIQTAPKVNASPEQLAKVANTTSKGKTQNTGEFTITQGTNSLQVIDSRVGVTKAILCSPMDANSSNWYISDIQSGKFTVNITSNAGADAKFKYVVIGV